jgi:hypothetical protein
VTDEPKPGEWWVVESDVYYPRRAEREVARRADHGDCWWVVGNEEEQIGEFFRPVRKLDLWADVLGASLGASAQNERGNRSSTDDTSLQADPETEAPSGKPL